MNIIDNYDMFVGVYVKRMLWLPEQVLRKASLRQGYGVHLYQAECLEPGELAFAFLPEVSMNHSVLVTAFLVKNCK